MWGHHPPPPHPPRPASAPSLTFSVVPVAPCSSPRLLCWCWCRHRLMFWCLGGWQDERRADAVCVQPLETRRPVHGLGVQHRQLRRDASLLPHQGDDMADCDFTRCDRSAHALLLAPHGPTQNSRVWLSPTPSREHQIMPATVCLYSPDDGPLFANR